MTQSRALMEKRRFVELADQPPRQPSVSVLLIQPCLRLLKDDPRIPAGRLSPLTRLSLDDRVPITRAHELLAEALKLTGDPNLGLKAGRMTRDEDGGVLTYAIFSASTVADATQVGARYMHLLNESIDFWVEQAQGRAFVHLESSVMLPKEVMDYQASIVHSAFFRTLRTVPGLEWWFPFKKPDDTSEYARTFPDVKLRFGAPHFGFNFDENYLALPLPTADPKLHALLDHYAQLLLAQLPPTREHTNLARALLRVELTSGNPTLERVAARLGVSARTLRRRLESEGMTFSELVDDTRHRLALQYMTRPELRLAEVAFLIGFSDVATFHRAFKRWTGHTPNAYRRAQLA